MIRFFTALIVSLFLFANAVQANEPYVPKDKEELYGTWVNKEYANKYINSKWDFNSDGTWASYRDTVGEPIWAGQYSITEKWTDAEGNIWYKIKWHNKWSGGSGFGLIKISDSGETMEAAYEEGDYPVKIDPTKSFWQYGGIHYKISNESIAADQETTAKQETQEFNDEQKAVWKEVQSFWEYLKQGDLDSVMSRIHEEAILWWRQNPRPLDKKSIEYIYRDWINSPAKPLSYEVRPLSIQIIGNFANIYYVYKWSGEKEYSRGRVMTVYAKQNDKWMIFGSSAASCVNPLNCDEVMK